MALAIDDIIGRIDWSAGLVTVDDWLYGLWGVEPGDSSPLPGGRCAFRYPAAVADWLHTMWGITVPVADEHP